MQPMISPTVSIVVPCYNEESTIESLLDAISRQTFPIKDVEVIISDGMSTDDTREVIRQFQVTHPDLKIILIDNADRIIPAALNRGIEVSQGDYVIRLDAHSIPYRTYIQMCVKVLDETGAANAGGVWEIQPGGDGWIARSIAAAAGHPMGAGGARYRLGGSEGIVDTVPFGAFKRTWLDHVGPFDESLLTNEDYEYNVRLREAGGLVWFDPEIRSIYLARPNLSALARQYWRYGFWKARMLRRYPKSLKPRQALPPLFVALTLLGLIFSPFFPFARLCLGVQLASYLILLFGAGFLTAIHRKDAGMLIGVPVSTLTMHFAWGTAFLWSVLGMLRGAARGTS
jgi:glycosyltransferase involved in cell wall biosynthesis